MKTIFRPISHAFGKCWIHHWHKYNDPDQWRLNVTILLVSTSHTSGMVQWIHTHGLAVHTFIMYPMKRSVYTILQFILQHFIYFHRTVDKYLLFYQDLLMCTVHLFSHMYKMYFNMSSVVKLEIELFALSLTNFPVEGQNS